MYQTFLSIISLLATVYCLFTKQVKMGLGFFVFSIAFVLLIPNIATGIKSDFLGALAMVLFVVASGIIAWKKLPKKETENEPKSDENQN